MTAVLTLLLAGCNRTIADQGQVVAIVGDEEITRAEVELEARERGLLLGDRQVRDALVRELVERKLLVLHARDEKLDRTPEFILATRRLGEVALTQRLLATLDSGAAPASAIQRFIAENPRFFDERTLYSVDYVQIPQPLAGALKDRLSSAKSAGTIEQIVASGGIEAERRQELWDTASLTPANYEAIKGLRPGDTFRLPVGRSILAGVLSFSSLQPVPKSQRAAVAQAMMQREAKQRALNQLLSQLEPRARITYSPQFAPGAPAAGPR